MSEAARSTSGPHATALVAEDEPLLAQALLQMLGSLWPALEVLATVGDGISAVQQALALRPQVLFFDIRMPGLSGLEAAAEIADGWGSATPLPLLVFITAYDQYAVQAFETQAVDYVLKPVQRERLESTLHRLFKKLLANVTVIQSYTAIDNIVSSDHDTLSQLRALLAPPATQQPQLQRIQASVGSSIRMVPIDEVLYFEAADKYVRVLTAEREYLIRTPIKDLIPQLDAQEFWQIHRSTLVRASAITGVERDEAGKLSAVLAGRSEKLAVSRLYAHLFKPM
jgi:DNA-binding LytR/AlgR family response regulator